MQEDGFLGGICSFSVYLNSMFLLMFTGELSACRETEPAPVWKTTGSFPCAELVNVAIT